MPTCEDCGGHVSRQYARVMGLNGAVQGCPDCKTKSEMFEGAGVGL